jgi:hypothetical protein
MLDILIGTEKILSALTATFCITAFAFTIRHRIFYSVWARSSILIAGLVAMSNFFGSLGILNGIGGTQGEIVLHILFSLSIALSSYTILRFKWGLKKQYKKMFESYVGCQNIDCSIFKTNKTPVKGYWLSFSWPWLFPTILHINKDKSVKENIEFEIEMHKFNAELDSKRKDEDK